MTFSLEPLGPALDQALVVQMLLLAALPRLEEVLPLVLRLVNHKCGFRHVACVLALQPDAYTWDSDRQGRLTVSFPGGAKALAKVLGRRAEAWKHAVEQGSKDLDHVLTLSESACEDWVDAKVVLRSPAKSPRKHAVARIVKPQLLFAPKRRSEAALAQATGLSLLERIRAKETARAAVPQELPETRHRLFVQSHMGKVYDVVYGMRQKAPPLETVVETIQDSVAAPLSSAEVVEVLRELGKHVAITVTTSGSQQAVVVGKLDRVADHRLLKSV